MPNNIVESQLQWVRTQFTKWKVDGLLISSGSNRRWLSGFTGSSGQLLITQEKALLATDFRYWEQAARQAPAYTLFKHQRTHEDTQAFLREADVKRIGVEAGHLTVLELKQLKTADSSIKWVSLAETVEPLRAVKTAEELAIIRRAAAITDQAAAQIPALAHPAMTEKQLAWEIEKLMRELGAEATAFTLTVASGPNGASPHHSASDRPLQVGDAIIVDMGAQVDGYKSDLTRTFFLGNEPTGEFWRVYNLVLAAQTAVLQQAKAGMTSKAIDALARDMITAAGHKEQFGHGLGHSLGLDIHEKPQFTFRDDAMGNAIIPAGAVMTVEPGVYIPGWGGVRIEDLVLVTETGLELLSHAPKSPIIQIK